MIHTIIRDKPTRLFIILAGIFISTALIAEFIGVKIFSLEATLGIKPAAIHLFGGTYSFNLTCGVLLWPVVFVMTDIINEYYGVKGVRFLSWLTIALIGFGFLIVFGALQTTPNTWWVTSKKDIGIENMETAFHGIYGQGLGIIIASMTAFLVAQLLDVFVFHKIKKWTGEKKIWLRATGSTIVSQLIDSFVVLIIAFYLYPKLVKGQGDPWPFDQLIAICIVNYIYKFIVALLLTPVIYAVHGWIEKYLGHERAAEMKKAAMSDE
ncbi:MAG TPA: queuosine precursor transporter [Chitinophagaceae bacterium]|nr:queuosine precursor transporter [Chitinophagaceae bacterium]HPH32960.1 queuosine precursor transporter [Chitinophagaceae bacterium]HPN59232.1 queuosine precursor transporter [Chitinophagaceae bacterium]